MIGHTVTPVAYGFSLITTCLGNMVSGRGNTQSLQSSLTHGTFSPIETVENEEDPPYGDLSKFGQIETIGIIDNPNTKDDEECMRIFSSTIKQKSGRYIVKWPFNTLTTITFL